jgi:hypothetical protein
VRCFSTVIHTRHTVDTNTRLLAYQIAHGKTYTYYGSMAMPAANQNVNINCRFAVIRLDKNSQQSSHSRLSPLLCLEDEEAILCCCHARPTPLTPSPTGRRIAPPENQCCPRCALPQIPRPTSGSAARKRACASRERMRPPGNALHLEFKGQRT